MEEEIITIDYKGITYTVKRDKHGYVWIKDSNLGWTRAGGALSIDAAKEVALDHIKHSGLFPK